MIAIAGFICSNMMDDLADFFQGAPSGEAFIQMDSEFAAETAALNRHKKFMLLSGPSGSKKRYIEVFQCSSADMSVILTASDLPGATMPLASPTNLAAGLPSTVNISPPSLPSQVSPAPCSPPALPLQSPQIALQQYLPRPPLLAASKSPFIL